MKNFGKNEVGFRLSKKMVSYSIRKSAKWEGGGLLIPGLV